MPRSPTHRASEETTLVTATMGEQPVWERDDEPRPALVVTWAAGDWDRVGSVVQVADGKLGGAGLLGRGEPQFSDPHDRVRFVRQRPGGDEVLEPIANSRISRQQLVLRNAEDGFDVESVGRGRVLVEGKEVRSCRVRDGELLELAGQLHLLCTTRPLRAAGLRSFPRDAMPAFGEADPFGFVGESPTSWALRDQLAFMAKHGGHVLLLGPSGSGKELAAKTLHLLSSHAKSAMISRNAATFPATLIEAELFGNAKDYPNRGMAARPGLIGAADGSTLFLDEIAELPQELQARLLRVLDEDGEYHRLGEASARKAQFRLVGATNRPISDLRGDVAARMRLRVHLPDINTRREDIPLLCRHLLGRAVSSDPSLVARFYDSGHPRISAELMRELVTHHYQRNVREIDSLLWSSLASSRRDVLELTDAVISELGESSESAEEARAPTDLTPEEIQACLDRHGGVQSKAWRELGFKNRHVLKRLVKKYGLRAAKTDDERS